MGYLNESPTRLPMSSTDPLWVSWWAEGGPISVTHATRSVAIYRSLQIERSIVSFKAK